MLPAMPALRESMRRALPPRRWLASQATSRSHFFPSEPSQPSVLTMAIPGPASSSASQAIGSFQDNKAHGFVVDYGKSHGNWIVDAGACRCPGQTIARRR